MFQALAEMCGGGAGISGATLPDNLTAYYSQTFDRRAVGREGEPHVEVGFIRIRRSAGIGHRLMVDCPDAARNCG
jgi:hypothetical protein